MNKEKFSRTKKLILYLINFILLGSCNNKSTEYIDLPKSYNDLEYHYYNYRDSTQYLLLQEVLFDTLHHNKIIYGQYPTQSDKADIIIYNGDTINISSLFLKKTDFIPRLEIFEYKYFLINKKCYFSLYGSLTNYVSRFPEPIFIIVIELNKSSYHSYGLITFNQNIDDVFESKNGILNCNLMDKLGNINQFSLINGEINFVND